MKSSLRRLRYGSSLRSIVISSGVLLLSASVASAQYSVRHVGLGPEIKIIGANFTVASPGQEITLYTTIKNAQHYLCESDPPACSQRVNLLWLGPSDKSDISAEKRDWLRWLKPDVSEKHAPIFFKQEISFLTENRVYQTAVTVQEEGLQHFGVCIQSPNQVEDCGAGDLEIVTVEVQEKALRNLDLGISAGFDIDRNQRSLTVHSGSEFWWFWTIENENQIYFDWEFLNLYVRAPNDRNWKRVVEFGEFSFPRQILYHEEFGSEKWEAPNAVGTYRYLFCIKNHFDSNSTNDCSPELKLLVQ